MKLLSFEIKNYKCIESIVAPVCSNLTDFIGRNSAGKTSSFEALKLIRKIHQTFDNNALKEIVHGGVERYNDKFIVINYSFEIPEKLRKEYVMHYLNLREDAYATISNSELFKEVQISIKLKVRGDEANISEYDNILILNTMSILNTKGETVSLLVNYSNGSQLDVSNFRFVQNPTSQKTCEIIDKELNDIIGKKCGGNYKELKELKNPRFSLQGKIIKDIISNIKSIEAIRESQKQSQMEFKKDAGERGSDLVGLMHTLFNNNHQQFRQIEDICRKIFPDIIEIHPDLLPNRQIRILVKKRLLQNEIDLAQEGSGIDQLFIIIWSIATAEEGTIWFLDEPELHLHPGAQKLLYDFFREQSENVKQIFVATHSMIFIHNSKPDEIYMLVDKDGKAQLIRMSDLIPLEERDSLEGINKIRTEVYEVLGYKPEFSFEPKTIVFVEGSTDIGILKAFVKTLLNKQIDEKAIRFIISGSSSALEKFGPLLVYAMMGKNVIIIRDNDKENPTELKEKMLKLEKQYREQARISTPILSDNNFHFYPDSVSSIEYYLLEAKAIVETSNLPESERDAKIKTISDEITKSKSISRQGKFRAKSFLENLYNKNFGAYDEVDTAISIAENTPKEVIESYPELVTLIKRICD